MVSKSGFLSLVQIELLLLTPGQELQGFSSLMGAVSNFRPGELH